jgi:hypothetical protein
VVIWRFRSHPTFETSCPGLEVREVSALERIRRQGVAEPVQRSWNLHTVRTLYLCWWKPERPERYEPSHWSALKENMVVQNED